VSAWSDGSCLAQPRRFFTTFRSACLVISILRRVHCHPQVPLLLLPANPLKNFRKDNGLAKAPSPVLGDMARAQLDTASRNAGLRPGRDGKSLGNEPNRRSALRNASTGGGSVKMRRSSPRKVRSWVKVPPVELDGSRQNSPVPVRPQSVEGSQQSGYRTDGPE
jgi:hypothetical protein